MTQFLSIPLFLGSFPACCWLKCPCTHPQRDLCISRLLFWSIPCFICCSAPNIQKICVEAGVEPFLHRLCVPHPTFPTFQTNATAGISHPPSNPAFYTKTIQLHLFFLACECHLKALMSLLMINITTVHTDLFFFLRNTQTEPKIGKIPAGERVSAGEGQTPH